MEVLALLGSPRAKANSTLIAEQLCRRAEELGAEVRSYYLNRMQYRGCQACDACRQGPHTSCVLQDDLREVLQLVHTADVLVLATPVYFGDVSSQMKAFIDRTRSFLKPDFRTNPVPSRLPPGKKMVFIQTQAESSEATHADIFPRYDFFFSWFGYKGSILLRACDVYEAGAVESHQVLLRAAEVAEQLAARLS